MRTQRPTFVKSPLPRPALALPPSFSSREFRNALGMFATGVTIVTARNAAGELVGLTASSFNSVSLDPPLVLWSLVTHSPNLAVFSECSHFAINILGSGQEELAMRFANPKITNKFDDVMMEETCAGIPVLQSAVTTLLCEHDHNRQTGDHLLLIGRVVRTASRPGSPLVFHAGRFTSLP